MANPALIAKAVAMALSDERLRRGIGWTIVAVLSPLIVIIAILCGMLSGAANHNNSALDLCFHGGTIPDSVPVEYRGHIVSMRSSFDALDSIIGEINNEAESGKSLDSVQVKSVFYALYFGESQPSMAANKKFADCFVTYEQRTKTEKNDDGTISKSTYTVAVPIKDLSLVYRNIASAMGHSATYEDMSNATEIYYRIAYGRPAPKEDDSVDGWEGWAYQPTAEELANLYHNLPTGELGSEVVKMAMTRLGDPYSQEKRGQGSYVDCSYLTMWCYKQLGITIPGTASEQGRFCVNNGLTIAKKDLVPGDLVFWSHKPNGRFMNITHVGVYAGDGKVIDASFSKGVVVYRNLFDSDKQVLYGRPHIKK